MVPKSLIRWVKWSHSVTVQIVSFCSTSLCSFCTMCKIHMMWFGHLFWKRCRLCNQIHYYKRDNKTQKSPFPTICVTIIAWNSTCPSIISPSVSNYRSLISLIRRVCLYVALAPLSLFSSKCNSILILESNLQLMSILRCGLSRKTFVASSATTIRLPWHPTNSLHITKRGEKDSASFFTKDDRNSWTCDISYKFLLLVFCGRNHVSRVSFYFFLPIFLSDCLSSFLHAVYQNKKSRRNFCNMWWLGWGLNMYIPYPHSAKSFTSVSLMAHLYSYLLQYDDTKTLSTGLSF